MAYPALGIDVSKLTLDAALLLGDPAEPGGARLVVSEFRNTPAGHRKLMRWADAHGASGALACMEATALHWKPLAEALHGAGRPTAVCNPFVIRSYGQSRLQRNKTDPADAELIARFAAREEPGPWRPLGPAYDALRELYRRRDQLISALGAERNRRGAGYRCKDVLESIDASIASLTAQLRRLDGRIEAHIRSDERLREQHRLLQTIPGVGSVAATAIMAELGDLTRFDSAKQVVAHAGLTPGQRQSGTSLSATVGITHMGSARLRHALYMPAVTAATHDPGAKALVYRLVPPGESQTPGLVAVMARLLRLAFGVLKRGRPYDPALAGSRHPVEPRWLRKEKAPQEKQEKPLTRTTPPRRAKAGTTEAALPAAPSRA
jgi:transposase